MMPFVGLIGPIGLLVAVAASAASLGGFDLANLAVDRKVLVAGGPGKDGIKTVDAPEFSHIGEAGWIGRDTEVLGVEVEGESKAYPLRMLEYHQIVNDVVGGVPIAVTYDPLAGAPLAYRREVGDDTLVFGVSGLLYNHNFLLFDRKTESLWSQFLGRAVAGPLAGKQLVRVPVRQETAGVWISRHMESLFMRPPFPEKVHYRLSPYASYWVEDKTLFPLAAVDASYHPKELVVGVVVDGKARAYLGSILTRDGDVDERIAGKRVRVHYVSDTGTFQWQVDEGVEVVECYWLAWKAFHPATEIWHGGESAAEAKP